MSVERIRRIEALFQAAADLPAGERPRYLEENAAGDAALVAEVEELLALHEAETHVESIGPYKLLGAIGEGGCGVVYRARQTTPVRREVALKVIKEGMDTRQVIARFEAEGQALALMDHPGIARVFDAGATEQGRPWFAMELVQGERITTYCDRHRLDTEARLALFIQVCEAVQHAHQRGVIHRDLKPSNLLVEEVDDRPVPKVIDFGIAKAIGGQLTERTLFTEQGQLIGTPEYMSPEQAELSGLNVDTRTDIYSLGVVLYELLSGRLPFDPETLREGSIAEIQERIRNEEPPRPSTRVSSGGEESSTHARCRRLEAHTLVRRLRGDLDWVVMKALEKERARRYASASEFAADLRRHLAHEPVLAHAPGMFYRTAKFVRRNKALVASTTLIFLTLLGGIVATTLALFEARAAERRADEEREVAVLEARRAGAVRDFMRYSLNFVNPVGGEPLTVREMLDLATADLGKLFAGQLIEEAAVRTMLGEAHHWMAEYDRAGLQLREALRILGDNLAEHHLFKARVLDTLIQTVQWQSAYPHLRRELLDRFVEICVVDLAREHPKLAEELEAFAGCILDLECAPQTVLDSYRRLEDTFVNSGAGNPLAYQWALDKLLCHVYIGTYDSRPIWRDLLALTRKALATESYPMSRMQLRYLLARRLFHALWWLRPENPLELARELHKLSVRLFPSSHWFNGISEVLLGMACAGEGVEEVAERHLVQGIAIARDALGPSSVFVLKAFGHVLDFHVEQGRQQELSPHLVEGLRDALEREDWMRVFFATQIVARTPGLDDALYRMALQGAEKAIDLAEKTDHPPARGASQLILGLVCLRMGRYENAREALEHPALEVLGNDFRVPAVRAMVLQSLDGREEARDQLLKARKLHAAREHYNHWGNQRLLHEAEALVGE